MHRDPRIDALLDRHPDIRLVESVDGRPVLMRRDQLLATPAHSAAAADYARRWVEGRSENGDTCTLWLRPGMVSDPAALAAELRTRGLEVTPNHVLIGQPVYWGGPACEPRPSLPATAPAAGRARRQTRIGLLDTGLSPHPWYDGAGWYQERAEIIREELDVNADRRLDPQAGHGTFICGLVLQRAHGAHLHVERLLSSDGVTDELSLVRRLAGLPKPIDVINLSFGGYTADDRATPFVMRALRSTGAVVVACAGNGGDDRPFWPAACPDVIAVGALDTTQTCRADFSGHGDWVGACTRGEDLTSSFVTFGEFRGYARWSGTSFAAAIVAGAIAGLSAQEDIPAVDAARRLLGSGTPIPGLGAHIAA